MSLPRLRTRDRAGVGACWKDDAMTAETVRFVLNEKGNDTAVVHTEDCVTIQHQVQHDVREHEGGYVYEHLGKDADGNSILRETLRRGAIHYRARFVSGDELSKLSRRYRRCQRCAPDVPESRRVANPELARMLALSITAKHLGREFSGIGTLVEVRMSRHGYELIGEDGALRVPLDGSVEYAKPVVGQVAAEQYPGRHAP